MYIVILDFYSGTVFIRPIPKHMIKEEWDDIEIADSFENKLKIHISDCQWMIMPKVKLNIKKK